MATFVDIYRKIDQMADNWRQYAPNIVAETATEYYKERFRDKGWDGTPWPEVKRPNPRGSLMVRSGALQSTIRPSMITQNEVVISAGNPRVPYARIHNEGGIVRHPGGTAFAPIGDPADKRFRWVSNQKAASKNYPRTKPHDIPIPQRKYMGDARELRRRLYDRLRPLVTQPFNQ